jgi:hypothetical protein
MEKTMDRINSLVGTQTVQNANVATVESQPKPTSQTGFDTYSKAISETFGAITLVPSATARASAGKIKFNELTITKTMDKASVNLF